MSSPRRSSNSLSLLRKKIKRGPRPLNLNTWCRGYLESFLSVPSSVSETTTCLPNIAVSRSVFPYLSLSPPFSCMYTSTPSVDKGFAETNNKKLCVRALSKVHLSMLQRTTRSRRQRFRGSRCMRPAGCVPAHCVSVLRPKMRVAVSLLTKTTTTF